MSKSDRPDRKKIAEQFYGGYCELEDRTELDWQEALSNADQIIALIEACIAYWREKCWNDTMSAKKSGWDDCVKFYGIKEE